MGHAHHFLSRLDRVGPAEIELALGLYNDHHALGFVLAQAGLPEGAERVAIALGDGPEPPHILVTRDGRFVTCLAAGMRHDLPSVPRARLDRLRDEHEELRALRKTARAIGDEGGDDAYTRTLFKLMNGPDVSREDMAALAALAPLMLGQLIQWQTQHAQTLERGRVELVPLLRKGIRPKGKARDKLDAYFTSAWLVAHLTVITSIGMKPVLPKFGDDAADAAFGLSRATFVTATLSHAARSLFAAARLGPVALPRYAEELEHAESLGDVVHGVLGAAAIAHRHPDVREEVEELIGRPPPDPRLAEHPLWVARRLLAPLALGDAAGCRHLSGMDGARALVALGAERLPEGHAHRFARPEDVPYRSALPMCVRRAIDVIHGGAGVGQLACTVGWLSEARAEDLYLPAEVLSWVRRPLRVEDGVELLRPHITEDQAWVDAQRPSGPTRSGPCPCGSGKKYKRCCGAGG